MSKQIVTGVSFQIQPKDIDTSRHFWDAFDHSETEASAAWLVRLAQERGNWDPFTAEDIQALYSRTHPHSFHFNRLVDPGTAYSILEGSHLEGGGWIIKSKQRYHFTADFIQRCYAASPAKEVAA